MTEIVHSILERTIGKIFGEDITCKEPVYRCDEYQPGILVEFGRPLTRVN